MSLPAAPRFSILWTDPGRLTALLMVIVGGFGALNMDVVRGGFGIKGDEATYMSAAMSAAYDANLSFERRDLDRFWAVYERGPEGIFLKRGKRLDVRLDGTPPFVHLDKFADVRSDRLYFGKAFLYPLVAAPFVRLFGLNGALLLHVLLIAGVFLGAYHFVLARSKPSAACLFAGAFLFASITPLYIVWLMPEILNFSLVFFAYFLWLYKEVAPPAEGRFARFLRGPGSDLGAAVLLGLATFSKPNHVILIGPPVLLAFTRRQWRTGLVVGALCGVIAAACYGVNAVSSGEFNYQGGDRKTFYGRFPFDAPDATFDARGISMTTNEVQDVIFDMRVFWPRLRDNVVYFFVGRHAGLLPYFFPAIATLALYARRPRELLGWRVMILGALAAMAVALLVWVPFTWAGGGGPPGNRYFLSSYATLIFLVPPLGSIAPALVAWAGGALFTAHILINPFVSLARPWLAPQHGAARWLPVEMTMINDLPIMLDAPRARVAYGTNPVLLLYFLDNNAWTPEPAGIWVAGRARTEIIVRTVQPLSSLQVSLQSPVATHVTIDAGAGRQRVDLAANASTVVSVRVGAHHSRDSYACLLSIATDNGFIPHLVDPALKDGRFLGVQVQLAGRS